MMKQDLEVFQDLIPAYCIFFSKPFYHTESALQKRYAHPTHIFLKFFDKKWQDMTLHRYDQ